MFYFIWWQNIKGNLFLQVSKIGIVESVLTWAKFKADNQLKNLGPKHKQRKLTGIPKLDDANDAGTVRSMDCTLILTEGDSAKTMAVSGIASVGRDKYGIFPLKGWIVLSKMSIIKKDGKSVFCFHF